MRLIFIGDEYYLKSGTAMGVVYTEDWKRSDWCSIKQAVADGEEVTIRKATPSERFRADAMLGSYVRGR